MGPSINNVNHFSWGGGSTYGKNDGVVVKSGWVGWKEGVKISREINDIIYECPFGNPFRAERIIRKGKVGEAGS